MALLERGGDRRDVGGEIVERISAVGDPFRVAVAALVDRVGDHAGARDLDRGPAPGMARLPAAVEQQHRPAVIAEHVGGEPIARRAAKGLVQGRHDNSCKNSSTPALNALSPTESM